MRARAAEFGGRLDLTSVPGAGTTVVCSIPCRDVTSGALTNGQKRAMFGITVVVVVGLAMVVFKEHQKGNDAGLYVCVAGMVYIVLRNAVRYYGRRRDKATA